MSLHGRDPTRYERILQDGSAHSGNLAEWFAAAASAARTAIPVTSEREAAIRDVAAGVAAPALTGFALWVLDEAQRRGLRRLRFLSRDGQIVGQLAHRLATSIGSGLDLEYVYSSRLTWSLAATDPHRLADAAWLHNSFIKASAADVCARLGLPFSAFRQLMLGCGVSLDPGVRADQPAQADALRRFVATPAVAQAAGERITMMRRLVLDYAAQHQLADVGTGLVDIGWTGRMVGSFIELCEAAGTATGRPTVLFWGHEPRANGWTDPKVAAWMYDTAQERPQWRVPNAPFIMETFCMADHGIVSGYQADADRVISPQLQSPRNDAADAWGLDLYRSVLYAFVNALEVGQEVSSGDVRPIVHQALDAFWCHPMPAEAVAWGSYPYDSDPAGTAIRPLARPFTATDYTRGDRAWLAGSLVLSAPGARDRYLSSAPEDELVGAPETDLASGPTSRPFRHALAVGQCFA